MKTIEKIKIREIGSQEKAQIIQKYLARNKPEFQPSEDKQVSFPKKVRAGSTLTREEKEAMIQEYLSSKKTQSDIWKAYTGQTSYHGEILRFMRAFGYDTKEKTKKIKVIQPPPVTLSSPISSTELPNELDINILQNENKQLQQELKATRLQPKGYNAKKNLMEKPEKIQALEYTSIKLLPLVSSTESSNDLHITALQNENKKLKEQLGIAQLQTEGYNLMIELAEQQFNIPIRKKSVAK